jgi:hypothetical protein
MRHLIILIACSLVSMPVSSCILKPGHTDADFYNDAQEVFVARIVKTELLPMRDCVEGDMCNYVIGHFDLIQTLKGTPPHRGEVREFISAPGMCSLGFLPGWYYVFYTALQKDPMALYTEGSFPLGAYYDDSAKQIVRRLREPKHARPKDGA